MNKKQTNNPESFQAVNITCFDLPWQFLAIQAYSEHQLRQSSLDLRQKMHMYKKNHTFIVECYDNDDRSFPFYCNDSNNSAQVDIMLFSSTQCPSNPLFLLLLEGKLEVSIGRILTRSEVPLITTVPTKKNPKKEEKSV